MSRETFYKCDVCGKRIDTREELSGAMHIEVKPLMLRSILNGNFDLCASCAEKIKELLPTRYITIESLDAAKRLFSKEED